MLKKDIIVLANQGVDNAAAPNKAPYAARFNIRKDLDTYFLTTPAGKVVYPYKGQEVYVTQNPKLGNVTRYLNYYGRKPGKSVLTVKLKGGGAVIAQYTVRNFAWVAHRGYMGNLRALNDRPKHIKTSYDKKYEEIEMTEKYTENSMAAFEAAVQAGAYGIQTDPKLTKDGKVVLFHDLVFGGIANKGKSYQHKYPCALSNGPRNVHVYERTAAQIRKVRYSRVGSKTLRPSENKIVTLEQFLELCEKFKVRPVIDLSNDRNEPERQQSIADAVVKILKGYSWCYANVLALPGSYKFVGKSMGLKQTQYKQILFNYQVDMDSIKKVGKIPEVYRGLLNEVPFQGRLANWDQIKDYDWFRG